MVKSDFAHLVPTEPGSYFDRRGGRWALTPEGEWLDCHGRGWRPNADAPEWLDQSPVRDLFVRHQAMQLERPNWVERLGARMTLPGWRYYHGTVEAWEAAGWPRPNAARSPLVYYWRFGLLNAGRRASRSVRRRVAAMSRT